MKSSRRQQQLVDQLGPILGAPPGGTGFLCFNKPTSRCIVKFNSGMKLTFPACWTEELASTQTLDQDKERIKRACEAFHWAQTTEADSGLEFRVGINWKSWGERITVAFQTGKIRIHSRCCFPSQCLDWGKNKANCLRLAQAYANS